MQALKKLHHSQEIRAESSKSEEKEEKENKNSELSKSGKGKGLPITSLRKMFGAFAFEKV